MEDLVTGGRGSASWAEKSLALCVELLQTCPTLEAPQTVARQASLSIGFPRQEFWSGLPFLSPGDLPNPEIEPMSPT